MLLRFIHINLAHFNPSSRGCVVAYSNAFGIVVGPSNIKDPKF